MRGGNAGVCGWQNRETSRLLKNPHNTQIAHLCRVNVGPTINPSEEWSVQRRFGRWRKRWLIVGPINSAKSDLEQVYVAVGSK